MKTVRHTMYTYNSYINSNSRVSYVYIPQIHQIISMCDSYRSAIPIIWRDFHPQWYVCSCAVCMRLLWKIKWKKYSYFPYSLKSHTERRGSYFAHVQFYDPNTSHTHTRKIYSTHIPASHNPHLLTRIPHTLYLFIHALYEYE